MQRKDQIQVIDSDHNLAIGETRFARTFNSNERQVVEIVRETNEPNWGKRFKLKFWYDVKYIREAEVIVRVPQAIVDRITSMTKYA